MLNRTASGRSPEELDIVSAIWVMASHDERNLMIYRDIIYRLQLPADYDVKGLVRSRGELFRLGVPPKDLEDWKSEARNKVLNNKSLPNWIKDVKGQNEQVKMIDQITTADVFRSQFRVPKDAPKSDIRVIDWGLQHVERLRKSRLESIDARQKSIQLWIIIFTSAINILLTIANIVIASSSNSMP